MKNKNSLNYIHKKRTKANKKSNEKSNNASYQKVKNTEIKMGCNSSIPSRRVEPKTQPKRPPDDSLYIYVDESSLKIAYDAIIKESPQFICKSGLVPSVCLSQVAFPIANCPFPLDEMGTEYFDMPVLTAAFAGNGRILCFPHGEIIQDMNEHGLTMKLFQRGLSWLARQKSTMTPILLLGFNNEFVVMAKQILPAFGFFVEDAVKVSKLSTFKVVMVPSTIDVQNDEECYNKLMEYVQDGGGLAVFYAPYSEENMLFFPINKLLINFGLSYTFSFVPMPEGGVQIHSDFESTYKSHFFKIIQEATELLSDVEKVKQINIDGIVTAVRFYIAVSDVEQTQYISKLESICYDYLYNAGFAINGVFEPDMKQILILLLLQDIIPRLPAEEVKAAKGYEVFPGVCEETSYEDYSFELEILDEEWVSTGLYLPAGVVGTVICEEMYPNLHLQVGAHHESLIQKSPPWKRWPSIVSAFPLITKELKIASPYGGPVYIVASDQYDGKIKVNLTFKNFVQYPRIIMENPSVWENTKDKKVPFGEIQSEYFIISMPVDRIKNLDIQKVTTIMNGICKRITSFMSYQLLRQFRVVFDIDTESGASFGYPIVCSINEIGPMFQNLDKPSMALFTLINLMGIVTIPEGCFDSTIEAALAALAASVAFKDLYPEFDPIEFASETLPPIFKELWIIMDNVGEDIIPQTLVKFQSPDYEIVGVPEDTWIEFVREMCKIGKKDFTKILEQSRPIPLSVSMSCHSFQPFIPNENEEANSPLV